MSRYCQSCGCEVGKRMATCPNCGAPLGAKRGAGQGSPAGQTSMPTSRPAPATTQLPPQARPQAAPISQQTSVAPTTQMPYVSSQAPSSQSYSSQDVYATPAGQNQLPGAPQTYSYSYTPLPNKSHTGRNIAIALLVLALAGGGGFAAWKFFGPGAQTDTQQSQDGTVTQGLIQSVSEAAEVAQQAQSQQGTTETQPQEQEQPTEPAEQPTASVAESFSTTENVSYADLDWLSGEAARGDIPAGYTAITNPADIVGGWKAYQFGDGTERLYNATIGEDMSITCNWYLLHFTDTDEDYIEDDGPFTFAGEWTGNGIYATGSGNIDIVAMYTDGSRQYAVGSYQWPSGEIDTIALVRP